MALVGYVRFSTGDQSLTDQLDALREAGVLKIFKDEGVFSAGQACQGLQKALQALQAGDVLVVWKLDRLAHSLGHLIGLVNELRSRGCGFRSLVENIDTTAVSGNLVFHLFDVMARFERAVLAERTRAGLAAAKQRGAQLGRKHVLTPHQIQHARQLIERGESPAAVARSLLVNRSTLYRALARAKATSG